MTDDKIALLNTLPLTTRPGYCLDICLDKMQTILARARKNIQPSFFRKLLGGVSKDHARSVVATCNADLVATVRVILRIQNVCKAMAMSDDDRARHRANALAGYCERLMSAAQEWSGAANEFEANVFGSQRELAEQCNRLARIQDNLVKPVANLVEG